MNDSPTNWKVIAYGVGGCWLIFACTALLGVAELFCLVPILFKAVWGIIVYGYVGSTSGRNLEAVFVYWTLFGVWISWRLNKTEHQPKRIIVQAAVLHLVLWALALLPAMILLGSR